VAKKKRSKRETIRGMTGGHDELDPALWGLPEPPPREEPDDAEGDEDGDGDHAGSRESTTP
jgi:hypothetical protein